jgi:hypothetical protein
MILRIHELPKEAPEYFWRELSGGLTLAAAVAAQRRPVRRVYSLLPDAVPPDADRDDLRSGGKISASDSGGGPTADEALTELLTQQLVGVSPLACVLEDAVSRPTDPHLASAGELIINGPEVYHLVRPSASREQCEAALSLAKSASGLTGFLTKLPELASTESRHNVSADDVNAMGRSVRLAFVTIYDGETYMLVEFED